ncbi:hypothetical protein B0H66DRAFT_603848 [Apodospora peruviana]|uniref:Acid phosphatase-like protein n=1 Tax=Apodospora peruviana TaxID=516989 RepID=A0AAE0I658_9PEZI|nr:hypothetical protein B0H66DRAFT_603848 [Apodospora peruviana]
MHAAGVIVIVVIVLLLAAAIGWVVFTRIRAQRLGLPAPSLKSYIPFLKSSSSSSPYGPPQPAPGGIVGWINDRIRLFKNRNSRTATGAYEGQPLGSTGSTNPARSGRRGFGPLDPDEAWDARVGHEADGYGYAEEQELGLASGPYQGAGGQQDTSYGGGSYQMNLARDPEERGRPRSRGPAGLTANPFDDNAEPSNLSMRGVSPRPIDTTAAGKAPEKVEDDSSPTERKSIFRENV